MADDNGNPLLDDAALPPFSRIDARHVLPAVQTLLGRGRGLVAEVLDAAHEPTWETVVQPIAEMEDRISRAWSPVAHLKAVADSPELREAYNATCGAGGGPVVGRLRYECFSFTIFQGSAISAA